MSKSKGFKSYLNRFEVDGDKATFTSYLDAEVEQVEEQVEDQEEVVTNATAFFDASITPDLLPGEWVVAIGQNVLKFCPFTDKKRGISGTLFVTNYRITFVTADRSSYDQSSFHQRNQLLGDDDITLISVDSVYQVTPSTSGLTTARRRKLAQGITVSTKTKYLEIYCKNFQLHRFGFKFTSIDEDKRVVNAIIAFGFPNRPPLLFALEYGRHSTFTEEDGRNKMFSKRSDWEGELYRMGGIPGWEVTQLNEKFTLTDCIPECFVMPSKLSEAELRSNAIHFIEDRPPTWSYSFINGASLVRMAYLRPDTDIVNAEKKMMEAVRLSHQKGRLPIMFDLGKDCPSLRELQQSYDKLKELLMTDSEKEFWNTDLSWLSSLENTRWLQSVQGCLVLAVKAASDMEEKGRTVILKEPTGRDFVCLVSCLIQLILDPQCRTLDGFQTLIQKEWVAMAHPFQTRCGLINNPADGEESPVFLLFLDCVWQMLQQFPSSFAFTETYLTTIWDSIFIGLFETFLFNGPHQQKKLCVGMMQTTTPPIHLPSIWHWNLQFKSEYISFFNNPLYLNRLDVYSHLEGATADQLPEHSSSAATGKKGENLAAANGLKEPLRDEVYTKKLHKLYEEMPNICCKHVVLKPDCSLALIRLWSQCYLRWLEPAEIIGGGSPSYYLQQCLLVEEVLCLKHKLHGLKHNKEKKGQCSRPKSELIFSYDNPTTASLLQSSMMTSSFPFSHSRGSSHKHQSRVFTPLSSYLQNSTIDYDYSQADD